MKKGYTKEYSGSYESKYRVYERSNLKLLVERTYLSINNPVIESYIESNQFPLDYLGGERKCFLKPILLPDNSFYIGELLNHIPDGLGFQLKGENTYYEGYFENGKYSSTGRLFTSTGEIIQGEWIDGSISYGTILNFNNKEYEGELEDLQPHGNGTESGEDYEYTGTYFHSKKHGTGRVEWKNGDWYEGEFVMGRIEGKGKYHSFESDCEGDWKASKMHGIMEANMKETWHNGSKYEGNMAYGLKDGYGVYTSSIVNYKGYWSQDKKDGMGILEENGKIIEGVWNKGKLSYSNEVNYIINDELTALSKPLLVSPRNRDVKFIGYNGIKFSKKIMVNCKQILSIKEKFGKIKWDTKGELCIIKDKWFKIGKGLYYGETDSNDKPEGRGIWINNNEIYEGYWLDGNRNGYGRDINIYSEVYVGNWVNNAKFGFGVLIKSRSKYIGDWKDNNFNGNGVLITNELVYDGTWQNGLQHGSGSLEYIDKKIYRGEFVSGVISGLGTLMFSNGFGYEALWENGEIEKKLRKIKPTKKIAKEEDEEIYDDDFQESKSLLLSLVNKKY